MTHRPSRVDKEQGVSQPVYEAWTFFTSECRDRDRYASCYDLRNAEPFVGWNDISCEQGELSTMHVDAVQRYYAAVKRSLPSRLVRGRPKSYEAHVDECCQKLPRAVQSQLDDLLSDREVASSSRFRRRDWTVAVVQERCYFKFATPRYEEVKKTKSFKRFWKKDTDQGPKRYVFVIRGDEGKVATDDRGLCQSFRNGNPWKHVDEAERRQKQHARDIRRYGKHYVPDLNERRMRWRLPSRARSVSPLPPPRRVPVEEDCPDIYSAPNPFYPAPNPFACGPLHHGYAMQTAPPPRPAQTPAPFTYGAPPPGAPMYCPASSGAWNFPLSFPIDPYSNGSMQHATPPPPPPSMPMTLGGSIYDCSGWSNPTSPPASPPPATERLPRSILSMVYFLPYFMNVTPSTDPIVIKEILKRKIHGFEPSLTECLCVRDEIVRRETLGSSSDDTNQTPLSDPWDLFPIHRQDSGSSRRSCPPAPRLSNLTTPTTFSPVSSNRTGSSIDQTEVSTPIDGDGVGVVPGVWDREGSVRSL